jgi:tetratricopeptide (TPR) repeat protein
MPQFSLRLPLSLMLAGALFAVPCLAQQNQSPSTTGGAPQNPAQGAGSSSSHINLPNPGQTPQQLSPPPMRVPEPEQPAGTNRTPALMDPAGPTVSLQTSEAMFDIGVALNACGYDDGLEESDPVRKRVREEVNQATVASAQARNERDKLCLFIDQHRADDPSLNLAQYVSLALYLTPPPELTPSVEVEDMPPDATAVEEILPLLRQFADAVDLHAIWVQNRPAYDELTNRLHGPLTQMIVDTNYYLKMPAKTSGDRRFLVVLEPLLSPEETNARVYGTDYVVVASPKNGQIYMQLVRHAYLHYEIEPLLYQRETWLDPVMPILKAVQTAPLEFEFKNDLTALMIECLIKAIEARTVDTGIQAAKVPAGLPQSQAEPYEEARAASFEKIAAARQRRVNHDMSQGFVLTQYFYNQLITFERNPESLDEAIGPMVYGMDVSTEIHRAREVTFDQQGEGEMMQRAPEQPRGLDLAELKLMKGDVAGASELAQKVLASHNGDAGRADFILARVDLMNGKIDDAKATFENTLTASKDPRVLAWSHIYLGRILDVEDQRDHAVAEYKAALTVRDGQPDTKEAADAGLKQPFTLPHTAQADDNQQPPQAGSPQSKPNP